MCFRVVIQVCYAAFHWNYDKTLSVKRSIILYSTRKIITNHVMLLTEIGSDFSDVKM